MTKGDFKKLTECKVDETVTLSKGERIKRVEYANCDDCPFTDECKPETKIGDACGSVGYFAKAVDEPAPK